MKFSLLSVLAILSVTATAASGAQNIYNTGRSPPANFLGDITVWNGNGVSARDAEADGNQGHEVKRQTSNRPPVGSPAMSDANGNVVPYNRDGVVSNKIKREAAAKAKRDEVARARRTAKGSQAKRATAKSNNAKAAKRTATKTNQGAAAKRAPSKANQATKSKKRAANRH